MGNSITRWVSIAGLKKWLHKGLVINPPKAPFFLHRDRFWLMCWRLGLRTRLCAPLRQNRLGGWTRVLQVFDLAYLTIETEITAISYAATPLVRLAPARCCS